MFDFLFRRGNPTNEWTRAANLTLSAELAVPKLNGVTLGSPVESLCALGRDDNRRPESLYYSDLGLGVDYDKAGKFTGYMLVLTDEEPPFQPYQGEVLWNGQQFSRASLTLDDLSTHLGDYYWIDSDDDESLAFYEYPHYELQVESTPSGQIKVLIVTGNPLMAKPEQREAYGVDKPWPPAFQK